MKAEGLIKNKKGKPPHLIRCGGKEKIVMLTAYDYQTAKLLDETGIDMILVGDSLGMVFQGHSDTKKVKMADMVYHTRAVARGAKKTPIVGDMPLNSYNTAKIALQNAKKFLRAGAFAVKLEGSNPKIIKALRKARIPVMGHLGLLPQTAKSYRIRGKNQKEADRILKDAKELEHLGVFALILECIPETLAKKITQSLKIPTIGIGAGLYCDGQVLVINDMLGMDENFKPKHAKVYLNLGKLIKEAVVKFKDEVKSEIFPGPDHTFF